MAPAPRGGLSLMSGITGSLRAQAGAAFRTLGGPRLWGLLAGALWSVLVVCYAASFLASASAQRGSVALDMLYFLVTLLLPLLLLGLAVWLAEEVTRQRAMLAALADLVPPLIGGLEAARDSLERHGPASPDAIAQAVRTGLDGGRDLQLLDRLLAGQAELQAGLAALLGRPAGPPPPDATPAARRPKPPRPGRPDPARPAEVPEAEDLPAPVALSWPDLIRALDFPRDAQDHEGFRALKTALRHHGLAQMLQAAEDVLNLLSSVGVYMEDIEALPADPAAWRRFIAGARGPDLAGMGGIADPEALGRARGLIERDPIFRDTAQHFQRRFDAVLTEFGDGAEDARLVEIAGTRSGGAFTLLCRLAGAFP